MMTRFIEKYLATISFAILICTPGLLQLTNNEIGVPTFENRKLATFPELENHTFKSYSEFIKGLESYLSDNFRLRNLLVDLNNNFRYSLLKQQKFQGVLVGRNDRLFYFTRDNFDSILHRNPLTERQLRAWIRELKKRTVWAEANNIVYIFALVPDSFEIYREDLPEFLQQGSLPPSRHEQLAQAIESYNSLNKSKLHFISLRRPLFDTKSAGKDIYYKTDTHWKDLGAFYGYQEIMNYLNQTLESETEVLKPLPLESFSILNKTVSGDLAVLLGMRDRITELAEVLSPNSPRRAIPLDYDPKIPSNFRTLNEAQVGSGTRPLRAVVLRDSFTEALWPFLSEHFYEVRYFASNGFERRLIQKEKPDVVIHLLVDRVLEDLDYSKQ